MFEKIIEFLKENWILILFVFHALVTCVSFIVTIVKGKPSWNKIDEVKAALLEKLPAWILALEVPGCGSSKRFAVLELVKSYCKKVGFKYEDLACWASDAIEAILAAPQKK